MNPSSELEAARAYFTGDRFATELAGIEIEAVGDRYALCRMPLDDRHRNANGGIMGGVIFTLADFVFAVATNRVQPPVTVTETAQIAYLAAPRGNRLIGESHLLRDGKHTCFYEILIRDELGTDVARVQISGAHLVPHA